MDDAWWLHDVWSEHKHPSPKCVLAVSRLESLHLIIDLKCICQVFFCGVLHPPPTPTPPTRPPTVWRQSSFKLTSPNMLPKDQGYNWKLSVYKMNYKESQFPSACKWDAGSSLGLKGLIVSRSFKQRPLSESWWGKGVEGMKNYYFSLVSFVCPSLSHTTFPYAAPECFTKDFYCPINKKSPYYRLSVAFVEMLNQCFVISTSMEKAICRSVHHFGPV